MKNKRIENVLYEKLKLSLNSKQAELVDRLRI